MMAENGSIDLSVMDVVQPPVPEAINGQEAKLPPIEASQPINYHGQHLEVIGEVHFEPEAGDDQEVQCVYSIPRRRKKKRKR